MLHDDKETFEQVILKVASETGIEPSIIEKDYYVTLFLKRLVELQPNIIFKGGTSLSKCYKLINRFSEDIDLNIETDNRPTQGQRRALKETVVSIIDEFGFTLENTDKIRSRGSYNKYNIDYQTLFPSNFLKQHLLVETFVDIKAFPCERLQATSIIYDYLKDNGYENLISQYGIEPFELSVQVARRTLIDKLYALGDYYISDAVQEHSRHIYDIYKLLDIVSLNDDLKELASQVFKERKPIERCRSAKDGVDMNTLLQEIIDKEVYKKDYDDVTVKILFEDLPYTTAIEALQKLVDYKLF